jgi:2-polyprenyl-6-methoxyphenol hydroxylase-like FAD-dependent oxidoreductase
VSDSGGSCDVLIVGAGPVGLLLGSLLAQQGIDVRVLERRHDATARSRAIGVHPPGLACLDQIGIADALVAGGVRVRRGRALVCGDEVGEVSFASLRGPFDFVLSVPQRITEQLLTQRLAQLAPDALLRAAQVESCEQAGAEVRVRVRGQRSPLRARYVVGCDGRRSQVRSALGTPYVGRVYAQRFCMADLPDDTKLGADAAVFVDHEGLVESFPLPHRTRRWVASLGPRALVPSASRFATLLAARSGLSVRGGADEELSMFTAERFCAGSFARGRLVLAGDAAHVVSPIGGQGMNLGWLDARDLAATLPRCLAQPADADALLAAYARRRRRESQRAARRAELYMALGFAAPLPLRRFGLWAITRAALVPHAARIFTMQGFTHAPV